MYCRKIISLLLFLLCSTAFCVKAQRNEIRVAAGYGRSDLHWSIAGNIDGEDPDILSELVWSRLRGPLWNGGIRYYFKNRLGIELNAGYHSIQQGRVTDRDYAGDHRQDNYYNEQFNSGGRDVLIDAAVNYNIGILADFQIRPFIGYTLKKQEALLLGDEEKEKDLHSSYKTTWMGGRAGLNAIGVFNRFDIRMNCSGGLLNYKADALWNLIGNFAKTVSFRHRTHAYQVDGNIEMGYTFWKKIRVMGYYQITHGDAWKGTDRAYYTDGSTIDTRLNWVTTTGTAFGAGLSYLF
ncbi:Outer membrane protein beta-barrel domain-containing protein [Niabella drilacis]|uniref:Outer membrane protein beta-barrel domain-containing protein n=1 Tax=Niabella drilacis (strain DSM 25811 / CCM 8410 / CCUG 62505 / LMG 26954 / E90) TaxID=1285928 RepID=A0A1G6N729_NIADE|nr:Outer membrane protein beta-barrel domain-containing protein [Niabella drilacis]